VQDAPSVIVRMLLREVPSGQRFEIPMHDGHTISADPGNQVHRKRRERERDTRLCPRRCSQARHDPVGPLDLGITDPFGIGTATTSLRVDCGNFGFDVTAGRAMFKYPAIDRDEALALGVEPIEVPIEHERCFGLAGAHLGNGIERLLVTVQTANDVNGFCLEIGRAHEHARVVAIT
jgi:hypothetical protein